MHHHHRSSSRSLAALAAAASLVVLAGGCSRGDRLARLLDQANRHLESGETEKAEIEFKNVLQKDAQNAQAIARLGSLYHDQGRDGRAAVFLLKARELKPDDLNVRLRLGLIHLALGGMKEAREEAVYVLERQPLDAQAPLLLVEASPTPAELEDARQRLGALAAPAADSVPVQVALGTIALRQNRVREAEALFKRALAADPKSPAALSALGVLLWSQKDLAAAAAAFQEAASLSPARSPKRLQAAQFKLQTGDIPGAKQALEEITRTAPDYVPAWIWLADIALRQKQLDEADSLATKALTREPLHPEALILNARVRLAKGESDKAVQELERMDSLYPRSAQVGYQLALAYAAAGDTTRAIGRITQTLALAPDFTDATVTLGELHLRKRDSTAAIATLKPLAQKRPDLTGALLLLAEAYRAQGSLDEAAAVYTQLQQQHPRETQFMFGRAIVLLQQQKFAEARSAFLRIRELQPDHFAALEQLVEFDLREKKPAAARQRIEADLAKNPQAPHLHLLLAKVCAAQSDTAAVETALRKVIELQPGNTLAHYQLARLYVGTQQVDKAVANLREATRRNPQSLSPHLLLGVLLDEQKDYAGARDAYEKALALEPKSSLALNNLAYLCLERFDQPDRALELAQRARALLPDEPRTADTLGWALSKKKQYTQALGALQDCAAKLPDEPEVQYHLGFVHYMLGSEAAARTALQRALELGQTFAGAEDARQRLAVLALDPAKAAASQPALDQRLAAQPDDPIALARLAALARQKGDADQALAHYRTILQANPKNSTALIGSARLHADRNELPKAIEFAKAARAAAPENPAITHMVGRLAYDTGDHRWAASLLQDVARSQPDNPDVLFDWAEAAFSVGLVAEAETAMRRATELGTASPRAAAAGTFVELVALCGDPAKAASATDTVKKALQADSSSAPALHAAALGAQHQGNAALARSTYEKLLARYPEFTPAQRNLTLLYAAQPGDLSKASAIAAKARQAFPDDRQLGRASGIIAYRQGDFARAATLLQDVVRQAAGDGESLYYLGMAQCRLNKRTEGRRSLQRALELGLADALATEARRSLETSS